ncbi:peptidase M61 [Sphingobium sufflavum]|uniref:M61 family metallopeptidase n=1 Tax=Sphingobium sufflavum TaxID=1129547 RepID=UPI001F26FE3E|nr:peptidase M61 [Sphingobium sufflavum]MCE7795250.1 peptidase M61 [Sphingobium sufflavum]
MVRGWRIAPPLLALAFAHSALVQPVLAQSPLPQSSPPMQAGGNTPDLPPIPVAKDSPWPGGPMRIEVDASDIIRRIVRVRQTITVARSGPLILLAPQWLPGHHAPRGEIEKLAGLTFTADGQTLGWRRDPLNVHAFHLTVPAGAKAVVADFQYVAATDRDQGRIKIGSAVMNLQWDNLSLYPAGYAARQIPVQARITMPAGWTDATALRGTRSDSTTSYATTDYETLIDSPVFAGRFAMSHDLGQGVRLNIVADSAAELVATPDQVARHRRLVAETVALFGARPFDHYDFLLAISDEMGRIGLEHHRSSENAVGTGYFSRWENGPGDRNLLPHELVHSWNGKYRRPVGLATPDYATPMRGELLWVYEGQTQFWGYVLGARSGMYSKDQTLDALATIAAKLDIAQGRQWRPLADTVMDPIIAARRPKAWTDWQRSEDYYNEGLMLWLEVDALLRQGTGGKRGLDDFAHAFFAARDGDWTLSTYGRADIVAALGQVMPYDWEGFLTRRVDSVQPELPKAGLELGGYRLVYRDTPGAAVREREADSKLIDQSYGVGLTVKDDGFVSAVIWDSAAFRAGLRVGDRVVAVNATEYSRARFLDALRNGAEGGNGRRTEVIVRQGKAVRTIALDYSGGIRYPRLQKTGEGDGSLDRLLKPRL